MAVAILLTLLAPGLEAQIDPRPGARRPDGQLRRQVLDLTASPRRPGGPADRSASACRVVAHPARYFFSPGADREPVPPSRSLRMYVRPEKRELVLEIGPVDLPAHSSHHEIPQFSQQLGYFPFDATLRGFYAEVVDRDGNPVPQTVLHHMHTVRPGRRELFLPVAQRFVAAGTETHRIQAPPWLVGIALRAHEPIVIDAMFHNPTDRSYRGVRARLVLMYSRTRPLYSVHPFHLDVMFPTGSKEFDLPPGRSVRTWEGSPAVRGGIVGLSGHLHKYAEWLELKDMTTGDVIWHVRPYTDDAGNITGMPVDFSARGLGYPIYPDHRYRITSVYFNPTGATIPEGGMAKVAGIFVTERGVRWPVADPDDRLYLRDLRAVFSKACPGGEPEEIPHRAY
ncbi:MAG: hypothetical protein ACE5HQ_09345 [Gemmatimonadota bacterium]